jgi:glycolate oxidase FAD binding subunit
MSAIAATFEGILGPNGIRVWESLDADWQHRIRAATSPDRQIECLVSPQTEAELAEVLSCAALNQWPVLPCGGGSKLSWGGLVPAQVVVSTNRMNHLIEHAIGDLTVTVEAGMRFADLQATLNQAKQFLSIAPSHATTATIGGIIATADTGSLRHRYGGIRDLLIGLSFVRADGKVAKAGGRVVKNVAGYDLMKLLTGSYGTLGVISQFTLRVYPVPPSRQTVVMVGETEAIAEVVRTLLASALTPVAVDLLAPQTVAHLNLGKGLGLLVQFQSIAVSVQQQSNQVLQVGNALKLQCDSYSEAIESQLWQRLQETKEAPTLEPSITCKIGVLPSKAAIALEQLSKQSTLEVGLIHAGSGLGFLRLGAEVGTVLQIRQLCQSLGGFLSILQAPVAVKQAVDIWGYTGNALSLMQKLKHQFDPDNLLNPQRFVSSV